MQMQQFEISPTLQILMAQFDGRILVPFAQGVTALGLCEQSARNKLSQGTFPVPSVLQGSRRYIAVHDLAQYIDSLREQQNGGA